MLRTKITELGKLTLLDDGGLVCSVSFEVGPRHPPPLDAAARAASLYWALVGSTELAVGDLVAHCEHGVARYHGRKSVNQGDGEKEYLLLEYAHGARLYVPLDRGDLVQKLIGADTALSTLRRDGGSRGKWLQSYRIEVLPNAYEWAGVGTFPSFPQNSTPEVVAEWRRACATYNKALHADANYRQAAQHYFELQSRDPQPVLVWWAYRSIVLRLEQIESTESRNNRDEHLLLTKQYVLRRERSVEKMRREVETLESCGKLEDATREALPEHVRLFVWRRDGGKCVRCGSRERLEFDHIIPVVAGGSNTERNLQLLCESCNRSKGATV